MQLHPAVTQSLTAQQALEQLQFSGVQVIASASDPASESPDEEVRDLFSTRALLEEQAARLAAQHLTPSDIEKLERIVCSIEAAVRERRTDDLVELHRDLHFTIYRATKRRHLLRTIEELWDASVRCLTSAPHMVSEEPTEDLFAVRSMLSASKLRDANALGLMVRHRVHQTATELLERGVAAEGEPPKSRTLVRKKSAEQRAK